MRSRGSRRITSRTATERPDCRSARWRSWISPDAVSRIVRSESGSLSAGIRSRDTSPTRARSSALRTARKPPCASRRCAAASAAASYTPARAHRRDAALLYPTEPRHPARGRPTDHRQARLEETIEVLRLAWSRPTFSYTGRFVKIPEVGVHPQPPQGARLPLWIGGQGDGAIRIAAERGAGLFIWLQPPERVAEYGRKLRALRAGAPLAACVWTSQEERLWGGQVRAMEQAGVDLMVIGRRYDDRQVSELERFAAEFL